MVHAGLTCLTSASGGHVFSVKDRFLCGSHCPALILPLPRCLALPTTPPALARDLTTFLTYSLLSGSGFVDVGESIDESTWPLERPLKGLFRLPEGQIGSLDTKAVSSQVRCPTKFSDFGI
jgi:hypothetical protein